MKLGFQQYESQLVDAGLTDPAETLLGFIDADIYWSRDDRSIPVFEQVFASLNINALLYSRPAGLYRTIFDFFTSRFIDRIVPEDCETRTFLHDLPIVRALDAREIIAQLQRRKSVIIPGHGVVTCGTVGLEQAIVSFSSVCFACFVKFFGDYLAQLKSGATDDAYDQAFGKVRQLLDPGPALGEALMHGPFETENQVHMAMQEAGKRVVKQRLVDSYFGNLSYRLDDTLYISQTGSRLDALQDCIDPCRLDESSCAGITASSELTAHLHIAAETGCCAILHGHPKFTVVLSMDCEHPDCELNGECHRKCPHDRKICGIPVVPGEVGKGPYGLWKTVPEAMRSHPGVIVYGHGLFTTGDTDYNTPLQRLVRIENECRREYFNRVCRLKTDNSGDL